MASLAAALRPVVTALLMRRNPHSQSILATPLVVVWYEAIISAPIYMIMFFSSSKEVNGVAVPTHGSEPCTRR